MNKCRLTFLLLALPLIVFCQQELKIMSYNIRLDLESDGENKWALRKDKVAGLMNYYAADFISGQEVQNHQLKYLLESLPGYHYIGVGRDDGKEAGEYSCIFYNKNKFDLVQTSTFWLSPTPDSVSKGWDAAYNRVCTYGLFKSKQTKQLLWVFNTHFDHVGKDARLNSSKLILKKISGLNAKHYPVILTGDFNLHPEEQPVQEISRQMQNTRTISKQVYGNADTWNAFKFHEKPNGTIDYIFISNDKRLSVSKFATITDSYDLRYPSDHFPVMATILLSKK
jgi:endonuclease/exonuclease/phosphatase family metal-dependent hydrolase